MIGFRVLWFSMGPAISAAGVGVDEEGI